MPQRVRHSRLTAAAGLVATVMIGPVAAAHATPQGQAVQSLTSGATAAGVQWNAQHTAGDIVGAHAWGTYAYNPSTDRIEVAAFVKDTKGDSKAASVQILATYQDGYQRSEEVVDDSGANDGVNGSAFYTFASDVDTIHVQECVGSTCASGWYQIW